MNHLKLLLLKKLCIFVSLLSLILLPYANKIHEIQNKYEPRSSILNYPDAEKYSFALIGDSEFCSYFVDDDKDAIWKRFESMTGKECFPGALDAATLGDMINATRYLSHSMPANSTVFINLIPTKFISKERNRASYYGRKFGHLLREQNLNIYYHKYLKYMYHDYFKYSERLLYDIKTDRNGNRDYNRKWDVDGDLAIDRYEKFKAISIDYDPNDIAGYIDEIKGILDVKNIRGVFVITPLNVKQIFTYSDRQEAGRIYSKLNELHEETKKALNDNRASYIDLYDSVPSHCFADLVHTNACGDEIIARSLADYALYSRR